ncbi:MAG: hypothetical protein WC833_08695 [Bacteroidales bacterium]
MSRIAEKLANTATTEDAVTAAVEGVTIQQVIDSFGDSRATDAAKSAVSTYEKKHGLKDGVKEEAGGESGKKPDEKPKEPEGGEKTPAWAQKLIDDNKKLSEEIATMKGKDVATSRKTKLAEAIAKAPENFRARIEKDFERMNFQDDAEYEAWVEEIRTDGEALANGQKVTGAVVNKPLGGGKTPADQKPSAEVQARIDARKAETETPAILGLPGK